MKLITQADGRSRRAGGFRQFLKCRKNRTERRRARRDVECVPAYNRFSGHQAV